MSSIPRAISESLPTDINCKDKAINQLLPELVAQMQDGLGGGCFLYASYSTPISIKELEE